MISNLTGSSSTNYLSYFELVGTKLTIKGFPEPLEKINLYMIASAGVLVNVPSDHVFICTLTITPLPPVVVNIPPTFELPLIPKHLNFTNKDNSDDTEKGFTFPKVYDSEGSKVDLTITAGLLSFMKFDDKTGKLTVKPKDPKEFGTFFVKITLTDSEGASRNYVQTIILTAPEPEAVIPPNKTETIIKHVWNKYYVEYDIPDKTLKAEITNIDKYSIVYIKYEGIKTGKDVILDATIFKDPTPITADYTQNIKVNRRELLTKYEYYDFTERYKTRNTTSLNEMDTLADLNETQLVMYIIPQNDD